MKSFVRTALTALGLVIATGVVAQAQTPSQKWRACRTEAFWAAYDCFLDTTSYWQVVICNELWDADNTACDVKLVKNILWPT